MDNIFTEYELQKIEEAKKIYPEYIPEKKPHHFIDRTGFKYGKLKVLYRFTNDNNNETQWVCLCECNSVCITRAHSLQTGHSQSCGCLQKEKTRQAKHKYNQYDLSHEYGIGYTSNTNLPFYFDLEDYNKIKDYCWYENDQGYILSASQRINGHSIRMHRFVLDVNDGRLVDHKNLKRNDNRKQNLRIATKQTNGMNRPCNRNNKIGVKGVHYFEKYDAYEARIMYNGKTIYLGWFDNLDDAKTARLNAERELFGEFAYEK